MENTLEAHTHSKPFEAGEGIEFKILDDKILITGQSRTLLKEGNFLLDGKVIHVESGKGITISSRGRDTLVVSANLTKMEEKIFDLQQEVNKRLETIERVFSKILKTVKT